MCDNCPPKKGVRRFGSGYFDEALFSLGTVVERAQTDLHDVKFDTLVGTGLSGCVLIPALALAMEKNFAIVRKDNDDSHHGSGLLVGSLGARWVFVDDFISSGNTRSHVWKKVAEASRSIEWLNGESGRHKSVFVGEYMYAHRTFMTATKARADQKAKDACKAEVAARVAVSITDPEAW